MVTEELIKKQRSDANQVDAKYTVLVSGAGVTCEEKPILEALLPGVRLHFLRYGLFPKKGKNRVAAMRIKDYKDEEFTLSDADVSNGELNNTDLFMVGATIPREGYIYLINPGDNTDCHELKINADGNMSHVIWDKDNFYNHNNEPKDQRLPEDDSIYYKRIINKEKDKTRSFWIGYSPVQWAYKHFKKVLEMSDDEKKALHMVYVEAKGIKKGEETEQEHVLPYNKVHFVYDKEDSRHRAFRERLKKVAAIERKESKKEKNDILEDMFITLHDPIGCVDDIAEQVSDKTVAFKALVDAIQTGETEAAALQRYESIPPTAAPEPDEDYKNVFSLALASYKMVYSSKKNTKKYDGGDVGTNWLSKSNHFPHQPHSSATYKEVFEFHPTKDWLGGVKKVQTNNYVADERIGAGLHRKKVEGILGVMPRRKKRQALMTYRDELGNFLQTDYLKKAVNHYTENSDEYCVYGVAWFFEKIQILYTNPYDIDRHLLLNEDNDMEKDTYKSTDTWITWINKNKSKSKDTTEDPNDPLEKLWTHELTIEQKLLEQWVDLSNKLAAVASAKLGIYSLNSEFFKSKKVALDNGKISYQEILEEGYRDITKRLNKIEVRLTKGGEVVKVFHFSKNEGIQISAKAFGVDFDPNLHVTVLGPNKKLLSEFKTEFIEHHKLYGKNARTAGGEHRMKVGDEVKNITKEDYTKNQINQKNAQRFNERAYKVLNSRGFTGVLTGLQILNFNNACLGLQEAFGKEKSLTTRGKNILNTVGIGAELTEASLQLYKAHSIAVGKKVSEEYLKSLTSKIKVAGAIGGAITSVMCLWEGIIAFNKRDDDAAVAWGLAGVAFGAAVFISGPIGWIVLGIGFVLVALANIFTDSALEFYFKHFLLSEHKDLPLGKNSPMAYNRLIYKKKETLVDSDDDNIKNTLMYPEDALASLHDLTVCTKINYYIEERQMKFAGRRGRSTGYYIHSFGIIMNFNQFLNDINQLETKGMLIGGTRRFNSVESNTEIFDLPLQSAEIKTLKDGQKQLSAIIEIPDNKRKLIKHEDLEMVVAIRMRIDKSKNHYFPHPLRNKPERYIGAKFSLHSSIYSSSGKENIDKQDLVFDTLANLKEDKTW
nr:hypothetical protein BACY1_17320 [Tenacibaculum mesophilum]